MMDMNNEDRLIFVNIKHSYEAMIKNETSSPYYRKDLKDCTRMYWKVSDEKAEAATHILGCYDGIVKEVIRVSSYYTDEGEYAGRKVFEGEEQNDSEYLGLDIRGLFGTLANFRIKYMNL